MKKIVTLGMMAITITTNLAPLTANAAGVSNYPQCLNGINASTISSNCNLGDISSTLKEMGVNYNGVNSYQIGNSQNCPTSSDVSNAVKDALASAGKACPTSPSTAPTTQGVTVVTPNQSQCANTTKDTSLSQTQAAIIKEAQAANCAKNPVASQQNSNTAATQAASNSTASNTPDNTTANATTNTTDTKTTNVDTKATNTATKTTVENNTTNVATKPVEEKTTTTNNASFAQQVVDLVNIERAKEGLSALTVDPNVEKAALVRANEIQTKFDHVRPNGSGFSTALRENNATFRGAGENIAWGQKTPQEVVTGWMNSPGHRANIMNKNFAHIGVGNTQNSNGTQYWVQIFTY
jgi:uncharacterized protein YkwD